MLKMPKRFAGTTLAMLGFMAASVSLPGAAQTTTTTQTPAPTATVADASKPAAATPVADTANSKENFASRTPRYRIEAGDNFDLTFELSPEFNQLAVAVQPDGFVTLKNVGDIKVAGQTIPELTATLQAAYGRILNHPLISIVLKDFEKPYFIASGQVAKPGKYEMHGNMTAYQALAVAGGLESSSKHSKVVLFRRVDDQWTSATVIDVKKMENNRDLREDPFLHSGDLVYVPKNNLAKFDRIIPNMSMGSYMPLAVP